MKKAAKIIMWCFIAFFCGFTVWQYVDYRCHPVDYAVQSAPWYTNVLIVGVISLIVVFVCVLIMIFNRKRENETSLQR